MRENDGKRYRQNITERYNVVCVDVDYIHQRVDYNRTSTHTKKNITTTTTMTQNIEQRK